MTSAIERAVAAIGPECFLPEGTCTGKMIRRSFLWRGSE